MASSTWRGLDTSTSMPTVSPTTQVCCGCWSAMLARLPPAGVQPVSNRAAGRT